MDSGSGTMTGMEFLCLLYSILLYYAYANLEHWYMIIQSQQTEA